MNDIECAKDSNSVLSSILDGVTKDAPRNWKVTTLGECFKWGSGGTPSRTEPTYFNGEIPWVVIGDLTDGVVTDTQLKITESGLANSSAKWVEPGSVLVAMYGSIGKLGIAGRRLTTNQAIAFTNPHPINAKYLYYYLRWQRPALARLGKGATQLNISQTVLREFPFLLAPQHEQAIVVGEIEKQFSRLDEAVANLQRVKANLKRYKASVLKDAVEGRLVPTEAELARREGRTFETGEQLLQRVLVDRQKNWNGRGKYKDPYVISGEKLHSLPVGWTWISVDALAFVTKLAGFEYTKFVKYDDSGDLAVIKAENAGSEGFRRTAFSKVKSESVSLLTRSKLIAGDLLMVFVGAGTGKVACVPDDQPYFLGPNISMIRVDQNHACPQYIEHYLRSPQGHSLALGFTKAVAQPSLSMGTIRCIPIALPPRAEQVRIASEVDRRMSLVRSVEAEVDANLKRAQALRQSTLAYAFTGGQ